MYKPVDEVAVEGYRANPGLVVTVGVVRVGEGLHAFVCGAHRKDRACNEMSLTITEHYAASAAHFMGGECRNDTKSVYCQT